MIFILKLINWIIYCFHTIFTRFILCLASYLLKILICILKIFLINISNNSNILFIRLNLISNQSSNYGPILVLLNSINSTLTWLNATSGKNILIHIYFSNVFNILRVALNLSWMVGSHHLEDILVEQRVEYEKVIF